MFISTSQESLETNFGPSKRTSKYNPLAILFFFMGVTHIYSFLQRGGSQDKTLKIKSNQRVFSQTSNIFRFSLSRYLSFLLLGAFVAAIMEMVRTLAK
jgi:hypothetical protein